MTLRLDAGLAKLNLAHSPTGKVEKEAAPGFTLAGFLRWFSWWHFKPTKMIAGDGHLRCHLDRKI